MNIPQGVIKDVEKKGISLIISRIQSKSPSLYRKMQIWSVVISGLFGSTVLVLQNNPTMFSHENIVIGICQFAGALFLGITAAASTTTTDPALVSKELKQNIITDAAPIGPPQN